MNIDFVKLGTYCQTEFRTSLDGKNDKYCKTLFVAIMGDNSILMSTTPHILANASKCLLIHERYSLAVSRWYSWYMVQFINENGEVLINRIDKEFELYIAACGGYANQWLKLCANHREYYSCRAPWENCIEPMWNLYVRLKNANLESERVLISSLFRKDQKILELEKKNQDFEYRTQLLEIEKNVYKEILDDIKSLLEQK